MCTLTKSLTDTGMQAKQATAVRKHNCSKLKQQSTIHKEHKSTVLGLCVIQATAIRGQQLQTQNLASRRQVESTQNTPRGMYFAFQAYGNMEIDGLEFSMLHAKQVKLLYSILTEQRKNTNPTMQCEGSFRKAAPRSL